MTKKDYNVGIDQNLFSYLSPWKEHIHRITLYHTFILIFTTPLCFIALARLLRKYGLIFAVLLLIVHGPLIFYCLHQRDCLPKLKKIYQYERIALF